MNLKAERLNRGMSQRQFADAVGVGYRVVQRIELGFTPQPANALKIAQYFDCEVTDIWPINGDDPDEPLAA